MNPKDIALGVGQGLVGMGGSALSAKMARDFAREQTRFNYQMSITAHQREVADLRAAGLNPILSAGGGGAPQPNAPMASIPDMGSAASGLVSSALGAARLRQELKLMKEQTGKVGADKQMTLAALEKQKAEAQLYREVNEALKVFIPWAKQNFKEQGPGVLQQLERGLNTTLDDVQRKAADWKAGYEAGVNRLLNRYREHVKDDPRRREWQGLDVRKRD